MRHRDVERDVGFEVGSPLDGHVDRFRFARFERDVGRTQLDAANVVSGDDGEDVLLDGPVTSTATGLIRFLIGRRRRRQLGHLAVRLGLHRGPANDDRRNRSARFGGRFENDASVGPFVGQDATALGGDTGGQTVDVQLHRAGEAVLPLDLDPHDTVDAGREVGLVGVGLKVEVRSSGSDFDRVNERVAAAQVHVPNFQHVLAVGGCGPRFDPRIGRASFAEAGVVVFRQRGPGAVEDADRRIEFRLQPPRFDLERKLVVLLRLERKAVDVAGGFDAAVDDAGDRDLRFQI